MYEMQTPDLMNLVTGSGRVLGYHRAQRYKNGANGYRVGGVHINILELDGVMVFCIGTDGTRLAW